MQTSLPFDVQEAVVEACGRAFWFRDPFQAFLLSCGVPAQMYARYADGSKFIIARRVLGELSALGAEGYLIQCRIVSSFAKMRKLPDENVPDRDAGLDALRKLKELALHYQLLAQDESQKRNTRVEEMREKQAAIERRKKKTEELLRTYTKWIAADSDPQERGYGLENLLQELFLLNEIDYRAPYKTETEQIDGCFVFNAFHYIVEARWRKSYPTEGDLAVLKAKVDKKLESTRGLFVSMPGYRAEIVSEFTRGIASKIILMDGQDLAFILEGQISLNDALEYKIQMATQEGIIYAQLSRRFAG